MEQQLNLNKVNKRDYKKTYKAFIAWLIGFPIILIFITKMLGDLSIKVSVLVTLILTVISLYALMLIIYKGEYVYWINGGPNFEEAKEAGSEKRKEYAKAHLDVFSKITLISLVYGAISLFLKLSMWLDIVVITMIVVIATFSTITIGFDE